MPKLNKNFIGVFDSGLGGLTVLKDILKILPKYNYVYLGDTARVPYGNRSKEIIYQYTKEAIDFLFSKGAGLIIIACNTSSAEALRKIQKEYLPQKYPQQKVLGVIRPLAEYFSKDQKIKKVGVIGTTATINSQAYPKEINKLNKNKKIFSQNTPLLVPLVEENWLQQTETKSILSKYLKNLKKQKIEALIMGCTHYPFLHQDIKKIMGPNCSVPNTGLIVAKSLKDYLKRHPELKLNEVKKPNLEFYTTDNPQKFKIIGEKFLKRPMKSLQKISL
jgi:glutamate racemase